ncbi:MAG: MBL fold metallo-hydrolase [Coriobacteriia bacterium]
MDNVPSHTTPTGVAFLASGSRGNATLVHAGGRGVLVDCGLSARECRKRITDAGLNGIVIEAVLLTHEHSDHLRGVRVLSRTLDVPVYATRGTLVAAREGIADVPDRVALRAGDSLEIAGLQVRVIRTSHDAAEPVGFRFETPGGGVFGMATDTGVLTCECEEALVGCDLLGIESNHDVKMLEVGPYPYFLKQRILSDVGHLSNAHAARALANLASDRLRTIVGLHLSEQNNLPGIAKGTLAAAASSLGLAVEVRVAPQRQPLVCALP